MSATGTTTHALTAEGSDDTAQGGPDDNAAQGGHLVAYQQHGTNVGPLGTLRAGNGGLTGGVPFIPDLTGGMGVTVRRLTPRIRECERLQGYPDGHTLTSNGKPQSDSARYKQLGNSVAVPVFAWVAKRLVAVDQAIAEQAAA